MQRSYRYYEFVMAAFVTILSCSNLIGPAKIARVDLRLDGRVGPLLPARVLGLGEPAERQAAGGDARAVRRQGRGRGGFHPAHLQDRRLPEARGAGGLLRPRHRLQSVRAEGLI